MRATGPAHLQTRAGPPRSPACPLTGGRTSSSSSNTETPAVAPRLRVSGDDGPVPGQPGDWCLSAGSTPSFSGHTGGPRPARTRQVNGRRTAATLPVGRVKPQSRGASQSRENGVTVAGRGLGDSPTEVGVGDVGAMVGGCPSRRRPWNVADGWAHLGPAPWAEALRPPQTWFRGGRSRREKGEEPGAVFIEHFTSRFIQIIVSVRSQYRNCEGDIFPPFLKNWLQTPACSVLTALQFGQATSLGLRGLLHGVTVGDCGLGASPRSLEAGLTEALPRPDWPAGRPVRGPDQRSQLCPGDEGVTWAVGAVCLRGAEVC